MPNPSEGFRVRFGAWTRVCAGKVGKESREEGMKKPCPNLDVDQLEHGSYLS